MSAVIIWYFLTAARDNRILDNVDDPTRSPTNYAATSVILGLPLLNVIWHIDLASLYLDVNQAIFVGIIYTVRSSLFTLVLDYVSLIVELLGFVRKVLQY